MDFKGLNICSCYESGTNDIVEEFYEPVLSNAVQYDRIAGFFSSTSLAIAARGLCNFIKNGGKMRLITSPVLGKEDAQVMEDYVSGKISKCPDFLDVDISTIDDSFMADHIKALGWMLEKGLLVIKLAIVYDDKGFPLTEEQLNDTALFHQKVGVMYDGEGNELSFSGSINESATAWIRNDEEFKVFKAWTESNEYFEKDKKRFYEIWNGMRKNTKVYDLPQAVKLKLINYSKNFDVETISLKQYLKKNKAKNSYNDMSISLFYYQEDALKEWKENQYRLLFEMATGTGKTRTAIACIDSLKSKTQRLVTIISTPQNILSLQWKGEVEKLGVQFNAVEIIDGTVSKWDQKLSKMLLKNSMGMADHCIVYTTHNTASSAKFVSAMQNYLSPRTTALFVGDEVHWLGARSFRKALLPIYNYRIGLSATPSRWFDDEGTQLLIDYFGNKSFSFTIHDALTEINPLTGKHFLVNYYYHVSLVGLNEDETIQYQQITQQIVRIRQIAEDDPAAQERYERLLETRANIIKNAEAKYEVLKKIIDELNESDNLQDLIIFVSPQQIDRVKEILFNKKVVFHQLTESEGIRKERRFSGLSEREHIIKLFKKNSYKALVAIKCLDEGIDIPSASRGILMASSTNPREYVQRIGRIIRQDENKTFAHLYDICINKISGLEGDELDVETKIRQKEVIRLSEIAENSINPTDVLEIITKLKY